MTLDDFIAQNNGKALDYDGLYGAQCVDLIEFYLRDVFNQPPFYANAKDWYYNFGGLLAQRFDRVTNNPNDFNQIPSRGDIIIWDGNLSGSGGYGHIAVYLGKTGAGVFVSFDQNWGGMYCHQVSHNYNNVVGWLTPKAVAPIPSGGGETMNNGDVVNMYRALLGRDPDAGGLAYMTGKSWHDAMYEIVQSPEYKNRIDQIAAEAAQIQNLTNINNQLNQTITDITSTSNATKADKDAALVKIADLQSQLTTAMDKLKEAQELPQIPDTPDVGAFKQVVAFIKKLLGIKE
jgi:hypothetical protein